MELSDLIESIDIIDYISQFVELEEKNGEFWGLSPFKEEKTPSFSVRRENQSFYDFSSGLAGNVYSFVRFYYDVKPRKAIEILQEYAGVDGKISPKRKLAPCQTAKRFTHRKKAQKTGKQPVLPQDYMDRYERDLEKLAIWEQEGISLPVLDKFQVRYDVFSDRLVYPIRNLAGEIVNVGGRTLDPQWKEKKLRKYTYIKGWEGGMQVIYGLSENIESIQERREVILFEGAKSVMLAATWGITNCGAILTSHLSEAQMKLLIKLGCTVVFALDKEIRIKDDYHIQRLKQYVTVQYLWDRQNLLEEKEAPVDRGEDTFKQLYEGRLTWR